MVSDINVKGTNHKIGGSQADGQWVEKRVTVFSGQNWSATGTQTYTVSNYLPDDIYTYEVIVSCYAATGSKANDTCTWWVRDVDNHFDGVMGYCRTRTASDVASGNSCILPVKQVNGVLTFKIGVTNTGALGGQGLYVTAYRRLGDSSTPPTYYTLTINPTPADATVTFNKGTVVGNTCTVTAGTSVTYTVSKSGYTTQTGTVTVNSDQTVNVTLQEQSYSLPLYGFKTNSNWTCYLIGSNSINGYNCNIVGAITAKTGTIGASGSTITVSGNTYTYSSGNNLTISGITLYCYSTSSYTTPMAVYCYANASVGSKVIANIGSSGVFDTHTLQHPYQWTSSYIRVGNSYGYVQFSRDSSLDTTFTGS